MKHGAHLLTKFSWIKYYTLSYLAQKVLLTTKKIFLYQAVPPISYNSLLLLLIKFKY